MNWKERFLGTRRTLRGLPPRQRQFWVPGSNGRLTLKTEEELKVCQEKKNETDPQSK